MEAISTKPKIDLAFGSSLLKKTYEWLSYSRIIDQQLRNGIIEEMTPEKSMKEESHVITPEKTMAVRIMYIWLCQDKNIQEIQIA